MKNLQNYIIGGLAVLIFVFGIGIASKNQNQNNQLSGFLTSKVTNTNVTINTTTTEIVAAGANLQRLVITNLTAGTAYCAFGTVATSGTGLVIRPANTTSSITEANITDPNLLGKTVNCLSSVAGSYSILKY
jgi:hypothetical protein